MKYFTMDYGYNGTDEAKGKLSFDLRYVPFPGFKTFRDYPPGTNVRWMIETKDGSKEIRCHTYKDSNHPERSRNLAYQDPCEGLKYLGLPAHRDASTKKTNRMKFACALRGTVEVVT